MTLDILTSLRMSMGLSNTQFQNILKGSHLHVTTRTSNLTNFGIHQVG
jgi:hypothetical protein